MSERFLLPYLTRAELKRFATRGHLFDWLNLGADDTFKWRSDFAGDTIPAEMAAGGAGTAAALLTTTNGNNGVVALVTGAVDNQCSTLWMDNFNLKADNNPTLSVRVSVSSAASGNVQIGFVDSIAAGILAGSGVGPIVSPLADPPTLTAGSVDCCVATYDLSSALANPSYWRLAGARNSTTYVVTPTTPDSTKQAPTASTFQWISVALRRSERGATDQCSAVLYVNGVEIARKTDGAITNTVQLVPFILIGATSGTSRTLNCDAWVETQDRDISL